VLSNHFRLTCVLTTSSHINFLRFSLIFGEKMSFFSKEHNDLTKFLQN
jgi:hypothetical protein